MWTSSLSPNTFASKAKIIHLLWLTCLKMLLVMRSIICLQVPLCLKCCNLKQRRSDILRCDLSEQILRADVSAIRLTVKYRRRILKEGIVCEKQKMSTVWPRHGVEDQLPSALRHLQDVFRMEATPSSKRLWNKRKECFLMLMFFGLNFAGRVK